MGCNQSKDKKSKPYEHPQGADISATSPVVPAAIIPAKKVDVKTDNDSNVVAEKSLNSSSNGSNSHHVHNIQVAGHQSLRVGEDGKFLIKPVSRDALVIQHLLDSAPISHLPKTLHFLRPFVADFHEASFVQPLPASSTSEKNGLVILSKLREELAESQQKLTFEEYFNKCRERLETAEESLGAEATSVSVQHVEADEAANLSGVDEGQPKIKKSKSSVKKPWELAMANACAGLAAPCVMDIKLGKFRTTPGAPNADIKEAKDDGTTTRINGVRVTGLHYVAHGPDGRLQTNAISKALPNAWDRKTITTDEKLGVVIDTFLGACCILTKEDTDHEGHHADHEGHDAALAAAVFINDAESKKAAEDLGLQFQVHHLPALAKEMHRQLEGAVKALFTEGQFITEEFAFLSASVLMVYDAAAWWKDGSAVVPSDPSAAAKVILIDFDRSGPRSEHYSEDKIQFLSSIAALDAYLERAAGDVV